MLDIPPWEIDLIDAPSPEEQTKILKAVSKLDLKEGDIVWDDDLAKIIDSKKHYIIDTLDKKRDYFEKITRIGSHYKLGHKILKKN